MKSFCRNCTFLIWLIIGLSACQQVTTTVSPGIDPQTTNTPTIAPKPMITPTTVSCGDKTGRIQKASFQSKLLGREIQLSVYLPECYEFQSGEIYPVLYLLHGQGSNTEQWVRLGATEIADQLIFLGKRHPFIIVMPFEDDSLQPTTNSQFSQVLLKEIIPWIDATFRTCSEKKCRSIAGISRGAGWAFRLGLSNPELFESIAAHSLPSFDGDDKRIINGLKKFPISDLPRIWIDSGRSDLFLPEAREFEAALTESQIPHEFYVYGGYHIEEYWQSHVEEYISWSTLSWK
jgi:enterochelin esterase-like enzyme